MRDRRPDVVLLDIQLPDRSGLDVFRDMHALDPKRPVIFMTAHADVPMAVRALKSGAAEFIEKPFNAQDMLERIQRAIVQDRQLRTTDARWREFGQRIDSVTDKAHVLSERTEAEEIDKVLKPGMIIMAEPNPITPDGLFGIFLGHTFIVTQDGHECVDKFPLEIAVANC